MARSDADLAPDLTEHLQTHHWPGNPHELRAMMQQAARRQTEGLVTLADLADLLPPPAKPSPSQPCPHCTGVAWKELQCGRIQHTLYHHRSNISRAARDLGMSRTTVYRHVLRS